MIMNTKNLLREQKKQCFIADLYTIFFFFIDLLYTFFILKPDHNRANFSHMRAQRSDDDETKPSVGF